ncbi:hypothetical protein HQ590_01375 [bacterium]|nr:hypothetical protein [bacterium]
MNHHRFFALALGLSAVVQPAALAQAPKPPRHLAIFAGDVYYLEPQIDLVLKLTDEQRAAVLALYQKIHQAPALVALRNKAGDKSVDAGARRAASLELGTALRDANIRYGQRVRQILTAPQREVLRKADDAGVAMTREINTDYRERILIAGTVDKQREMRHERVTVLKQKGRAAILAVLSPEQKKALETH